MGTQKLKKEGLKEIMDEAEILAEIKEEERIRKKNTKVITMAVIGVLVCGAMFYWGQQADSTKKEIISNEPMPPREEELFPEAGKIKAPGRPDKKMSELQEPWSSEDDSPSVLISKEIKPVKPAPGPASPPKADDQKMAVGVYNINLGPFVLAGELGKATKEVASLGLTPSTKKERSRVNMHKVLVGPYPSKKDAENARKGLKAKKVDGFIINIKGSFFVSVGAFYKKDGAVKRKAKVEGMGYPSRSLYQPAMLMADTLHARYKGTLRGLEKTKQLLRKRGFKTVKVVD